MNPITQKIYIEENDIWGNPQIYKGIKFYPLKISDTKYINLLYKILSYPKNYIPDKQIIKMSYLKFILYPIQYSLNKDGTEIQDGIIEFLKYVTKIEDINISYVIDGSDFNLDSITLNIKIGEIIISEYDFDIIREIILEQNSIGIDYIEDYNPELEKKLEFIKKDFNDISFKDEIFIFCSLMRKTLMEISNYTIFQFKAQLEHLIVLKDYDIYKPLEASGQIKFQNKNSLKHYISSIKKQGRYDSILVKKDSYVDTNDIFKL